MKEFYEILSLSYEDLKVYKKYIIQHTIELEEGARPFIKKKRSINPKIETIM